VGKRPKRPDGRHQIIVSALQALRPTRTKDGKVHVIHSGGEHLSGRLAGVTTTEAYVGHHRIP